jgi:hypothetical protein
MFSPRSRAVTFGALLLGASSVTAQPSPLAAQLEAQPRAVVDQLFLGMRMGSASMVRQVFAPDVRFAALDHSDGSAQIAAQSVDGFVRAVEVSGGAWNEQIYDVEVRVDDTVASVWAPYTFYLNDRISHCGVNSIELLRGAEGWKITQISDTRRTEACPDPLGAR